MGSYYLPALLLVFAIPAAAVALGAGALVWARDALSRSPVIGLVGIALTAAAAGNLVIPRRLADEMNRPIVALFLSHGDPQRTGLASVDALLLCVLATSLAVRRQALTGVR